MQAKDAAKRLGITQRMLRRYEKVGLLDVRRTDNGYRMYSKADLRRAARIRDFIATGFSTREIRSMSACLSDENSGPCEGGIDLMMEKLEHIEQLQADLNERRDAILKRICTFRSGLSNEHTLNELQEVAH